MSCERPCSTKLSLLACFSTHGSGGTMSKPIVVLLLLVFSRFSCKTESWTARPLVLMRSPIFLGAGTGKDDPKKPKIKILGVCGGIGSGKSAACTLLVDELHCLAHLGELRRREDTRFYNSSSS